MRICRDAPILRRRPLLFVAALAALNLCVDCVSVRGGPNDTGRQDSHRLRSHWAAASYVSLLQRPAPMPGSDSTERSGGYSGDTEYARRAKLPGKVVHPLLARQANALSTGTRVAGSVLVGSPLRSHSAIAWPVGAPAVGLVVLVQRLLL